MLALALLFAIPVSSAFAQNTFERARTLYLGASYEEALSILDSLRAESTAQQTEIAAYRAFCLIALDRSDDAARVMAGIVSTDPMFKPSERMASPRVRELFRDVRRAALPVVVQREYVTAKAAFLRRDPATAALFEHVLRLLADPDLTMPLLADMRLLCEGFRDLSRSFAPQSPGR
jgi:hypothetical protein